MLSAFTPLATFERTCRDVGLVPKGDIGSGQSYTELRRLADAHLLTYKLFSPFNIQARGETNILGM